MKTAGAEGLQERVPQDTMPTRVVPPLEDLQVRGPPESPCGGRGVGGKEGEINTKPIIKERSIKLNAFY